MADTIRVPRPARAQRQQQVHPRYTYGPPMVEFDPSRSHQLLSQLWCLTHYYNPYKFQTRLDNFISFYNSIIGQCPNLLVIEVAHSEDDFVLHNWHSRQRLVQIVDTSMIWQKERVFNLALKWLPESCTKIAWADCDILCSDNDWAWKTSQLLDHYKVVQPYYYNARLPADIRTIEYGIDIERFPFGYNDETRSDGDIHAFYKRRQTKDKAWNHPGYLYAYRRDLIEKHGFYDRCIAGSSDNMMSQAMVGQFNHANIIMGGGYNRESLLYYWDWAIPLAEEVGGSTQFLRSNDVFHLYHGRTNQRQYLARLIYLKEQGFDHGNDLVVNEATGLYELVPDKQYIKDWLSGYYRKRNDDECYTRRVPT